MSTELGLEGEQFEELSRLPGYRVSRSGRVQSDYVRGSHGGRRSGIWADLKPRSQPPVGHLYVRLQGRKLYVHRLVLEAFVGPCPPGLQCLHGDGNPGNNHLDNLRWGTPLENSEDARRHGTLPMGEVHAFATLTESEVASIRALHSAGVRVGQIAKMIGRKHQLVSKIVLGQRWKHSYRSVT